MTLSRIPAILAPRNVRIRSAKGGREVLYGFAHDLNATDDRVLALLVVAKRLEVEPSDVRLDEVGAFEDVGEVEGRIVLRHRIRISSPRTRSRTRG